MPRSSLIARRREPFATLVVDLRRALTPARLVGGCGLGSGAQRQRGGFVVVCPFHGDRRPSMSITLATDGTTRVHCFGCGWSGDALALIAEVNGLDVRRSFRDVLAAAAPMASLADVDLTPANRMPSSIGADLYSSIVSRLLALAPLRREGRGYLDARGVLAAALVDGWGELPTMQAPIVAALDAEFGLDALHSAGLALRRDDGTFDESRFTRSAHRLLIPWRSAGVAGLVASLQRRLLREPRDKSEPKYIFPAGRGSPRSPYGVDVAVETIGASSGVAFVEGAIDVLALRRLYRDAFVDRVVVGLPGVDGWRATWAAPSSGRTAYVALDADNAGDRCAAIIAGDCYAAGALDVIRSTPIAAKDWAAALEGEPVRQAV
ncbi:MAG: CHC2 zinc finger domain-containing protein [Polyangiales bacterium]